jgi:hypothetical protein
LRKKAANKMAWCVGAAALIAVSAAAAQDRDEESRYRFEEKSDIRQSLSVADPAKPVSLTVDNVFGKIVVQGADVRQVELVALKTIRARSPERLAAAKKDVQLQASGAGNAIDIYVDGPFRCQVQDCKGYRWRDLGYEVQFDFSLRVPRRSDVTLKTVNDGDVMVRGVDGTFDVSNVNGQVRLEDISGSGEAGTVNGELAASFAKAPASAWAFTTVNGQVSLTFPPGLAADFKFKTMNGEVFSDFAVTPLPAEPIEARPRNGRFVYKREGFTGVRVGKGGPVVRCETLNGDIVVRKKDRDTKSGA